MSRIGSFRDSLNLASKLTPKRAWNMVRLYASYRRSKASGRLAHKGMPMAISYEPTTSCNLRCPECPSGLRQFTRPTGMLEQETFQRSIDELAPWLTYLTFYFQGEPYLNPDFLDMVAYADKKKIYTATSTNAHYLDEKNARRTIESGLDRLIISIDGTTQETYQNYRVGGKIDKVIEGTKNIIRLKKEMKSKTPHVVFQFLVVKPNEHQIDDLYALAKELGVDAVGLKTAQVYDYENGNPLIPDQDKYSRYRKTKDGTYEIKNGLANSCWRMWRSCVITWDGKVVPCCFDKDAHHQLGDVSQTSFTELWRSAGYDDFRQSLLRSRSEVEICKNCTEGTKVWA